MSTLTAPAEPIETPAPSRSTWGFGHVPALDGLRGAAVGAVLLYHGGWYLDGGYLGVDLFFVLSGYLITSLLLAERNATGEVELKAFWIRRFRRLMPALLVMLCGVALYAELYARPIDLPGIREDGLATLFYVANWHTILQGVSYWNISLEPSPLQHTWSLAIEEQFYLIWPFVVFAITRAARSRTARVVGWVALVAAAVSAVLFVTLWQFGASNTRVYEGTDTRAVALLLGAAWAAWRPRVTEWLSRRTIEVIGIVATVFLALAWVRLEGTSQWVYRGLLPVCSVLGVLVVAAACERSSPVLGRAFSFAPLRWLGLISYGLYLWHWPVFLVLDQERVGFGGRPLLLLRIAVSIAIAVLSYYVVERPIRRGNVASGRPGALMFAGGFVVAMALLLVTTRGGIDLGNISRNVGQAKVTVPGAPHVMVVGDSVAFSLVRPVVEDPKAFDLNPINGTRIGCSALVGDHRWRSFAGEDRHTPIECFGPDSRASVLRHEPDLVLVMLGARPNDYIQVGGEWERACQPGYDRLYKAKIREWLTYLRSSKTPVVITTIPEPGEHAIRVDGDEERRACVNEMMQEVAPAVDGVTVLDMDDLLCPDGECYEELEGDPVRSDGLHFDDGKGGAAASQLILDRALEVGGVS